MGSPEWYREKTSAFRGAWFELFGAEPSNHCIALGMSPAALETRCGDAWPGADGILNTADDERNWGAANLRALDLAEQNAIATIARSQMIEAGCNRGDEWSLEFNNHSFYWLNERAQREPLSVEQVAAAGLLVPAVTAGHEKRALAAMAAIEQCGVPFPQGRIHCDSDPRLGSFFVWFATFPTHLEGAKYYLRILCGKNGTRPARAVCERGGTPYELAAAMKSAGYYGGFHVDTKDYPDPQHPGQTVKGLELNIRAYASLIAKHQPGILAWLQGVKP